MNRLSFFLLGLAFGLAITTLHTSRRDSHSQSKQLPKGLDHESEAIETAPTTLPFTVPQGVTSARIVVDQANSTRLSQANLLTPTYVKALIQKNRQLVYERRGLAL